ncbi:U-box domain-containing protein 19-like [Impatiens glandulifera]|uniref:U-box domain-containing protein 19-like n=1 Tax=Impatiens glandulifera TaxID=253017 RepID=UPI001FB0C08E|nr:U-box domain-containing protein 19-like [Impatiens glandulifera]
MIAKSHVPTRRILTQPAVHPSQTVSPAALLDSLLAISRNIIAYRSKSFYSHHRNAIESIRLVRLLSDFFSEIKTHHVTCTLLLCLSDLYFVFQRIDFLLQDCCRDDSRIWMMMKCDFIANQFRVLMRTVSTTVDVLLPMCTLMQLPTELQETIQLLIRQARTSPYAVDSADRYSSDRLVSILSQFEKGFAPESTDLRSLLNHLGIQSWSQCNKEIKFLESELELESSSSSSKKTDLPLLCSLTGFMTYCRALLFDVIDDDDDDAHNQHKSDVPFHGEVIRHLNPDDFRCPISLEIMSDPVTLCTGHTYDRPSISKWLSNGNPTCPKTGQRLVTPVLVPNLALKRLIQQYCHDNGIHQAETMPCKERDKQKRSLLVGSEAADQAMKMLASFLAGRLAVVDNDTVKMNKAAYEIRLLTKTSNFNRSCLAEAGVIPLLLKNLTNSGAEDAVSQENAMAALFNLSKHSTSKPIIIQNGGLYTILKVLKEGAKVEARQHAAGALFYLASLDEYRPLIAETPGCISSLVDLIRQGSYRSKKNGLVTILVLLMNISNHRRILSSGDVIPLMVSLLNDHHREREDIVIDCVAILALVAARPSGTVAVLKTEVLNRIVGVLCSSSSEIASEHCVSLLLAMCLNAGKESVPVLVKNRSLMDPLYTLLSHRTRASKKAAALIRILHEFQEGCSIGLISPVVVGEQFVHAM